MNDENKVTPKISKLAIGIKCAEKMFRVNSEWGAVVDAVLALRAEKPLADPEYFKTVGTNANRDAVHLENKNKGNSLLVSVEEIVFTHTRYESEVNLGRFYGEFEAIWPAVEHLLKVRHIRRIGIVAEHRLTDVDQPSRRLVDALTKFPVPGFSGKFHCQFEKRTPTIESLAPDLKTSDFKNVIYGFYDSELDTSVPATRAINANLDVQRYFAPPLTNDVIAACRKLRKSFEHEWAGFGDLLAERELVAK